MRGETSSNRQRRPTKYRFGDLWLVMPFVENMSANTKGRLDHAAGSPLRFALRLLIYEHKKQYSLTTKTWLWSNPTYSLDFNPYDSWLPRMKSQLRAGRFHDVPEIRQQSLTALRDPKSQFQRCCQEWHKR
jgi:hypothetical protein